MKFAAKNPNLLIWQKYALSLAAFGLAVVPTSLFWTEFFKQAPGALLFPAIAASAWLGGFVPGLLVATLVMFAIAFNQVRVGTGITISPFVTFFIGTLVSYLFEIRLRHEAELKKEVQERHAVEAQLRVAQDQLQNDVRQRTSELALSEEVFKLLVAGVTDYAILMLDPSGIIKTWNAGVQSIKGFTEADVSGKHFSMFYPQEDVAAGKPQHGLNVARAKGRFEEEGWRARKDGSQFWAHINISAIKDESGVLRGFTKVTHDLTERKKADKERAHLLQEQIARAEAEKVNKVKDEFLAVLSHELRTPLTPMLGWTRMLRSGTLDAEKSAHALGVIERNIEAQRRIVEDLLDVSRIVTGKLAMNFQPTAISRVVEHAMEIVTPNARAKSIAIKLSNSDPEALVLGDTDRLQQVFWNLLSNAVKFTPAGGAIEVNVARAPNNAVLVNIKDTGIGIEEAFLPFVFQRFSQYDSSTTRKFGGLGLGLSIVRNLVELHGGSVRVKSAGTDKGSEFTVELPSPRISAPRIAHDGDRRAEQGRKDGELEGRRILVLDDELDTREFLSFVLRQFGAAVVTAESPDEARQVLSKFNAQVLVSDIGMSPEDGYTFMRTLRAGGSDIRSIAVTAYARSEDREMAMSAGFNAHIPKPIEPGMLCNLVQRVMN